jgi:hypothetical protein
MEFEFIWDSLIYIFVFVFRPVVEYCPYLKPADITAC